ncbi:MAG: aminotransferase class V-fold PLP-dependent enzyme [Deltaproteobacteria bacterium]|nr:aminotransferase class V-fold PLP-dependent enzyme [Deltaproteobacteria bacterium]
MTIYLDNAATSYPKPESVYAAVDCFMRNIGGNPSRSAHQRSQRAFETVYQARQAIAKLCHVRIPSRIVFTSNGTEALNLGLKGILKPGDHVITTSIEHNSINRPLFKLSQSGISVTEIGYDPLRGLDLDALSDEIRKETRMIVLIHGSNVTGDVLPVEKVGVLAREHGIVLMVDGAQTLGKLDVDVEAMNIDLLACPGHKGLLGPQGTGFLYIREGLEMETVREGGTGWQSDSMKQPDILPDRFESGTLNGLGIAGLGAGVEFVLREGVDQIAHKENNLIQELWDGLEGIAGVSLYGPPSSSVQRTSVVSFNIEGLHCDEAGSILDDAFDIQVRTGLHCAPGAHKAIGTFPEGTVRVSPGYFNTPEEMRALIEAVGRISRR